MRYLKSILLVLFVTSPLTWAAPLSDNSTKSANSVACLAVGCPDPGDSDETSYLTTSLQMNTTNEAHLDTPTKRADDWIKWQDWPEADKEISITILTMSFDEDMRRNNIAFTLSRDRWTQNLLLPEFQPLLEKRSYDTFMEWAIAEDDNGRGFVGFLVSVECMLQANNLGPCDSRLETNTIVAAEAWTLFRNEGLRGNGDRENLVARGMEEARPSRNGRNHYDRCLGFRYWQDEGKAT